MLEFEHGITLSLLRDIKSEELHDRFLDGFRFREDALEDLLDGYLSSNERIDGEAFEHGVAAYFEALGSKSQVLHGQGKDLRIEDVGHLEVKKSAHPRKPNVLLNTTFPSGEQDQFYLFVTNAPQSKADLDDFEDPTGRLSEMEAVIVPSRSLRKVILVSILRDMGHNVRKNAKITPDLETAILKRIDQGIQSLNLARMVGAKMHLTGSDEDEMKSFCLGMLRIRFKSMLEPRSHVG